MLETATNNSVPYMHHHSLDLRQFPPNVKERLTKLHNALKKIKAVREEMQWVLSADKWIRETEGLVQMP